MNPVGVPNPPRWLIKEQASWVSAGVWGTGSRTIL